MGEAGDGAQMKQFSLWCPMWSPSSGLSEASSSLSQASLFLCVFPPTDFLHLAEDT
jgi:hypothetical protein